MTDNKISKDINTIITIFHSSYDKVEKCLSMLNGDMENILKAQIELLEIKDIMSKVKTAIC